MSPRKSIALTLAAVLSSVAVAVAGCGGPEQLSESELVERGDRICTGEREQFEQIQADPLTSAAVGAEQAGELLEVAKDAQDDLRNLEPPEEIRDAYDTYLDERDKVGDLLEQGKEAAEDKDGAAYGRAQEEAAAGALVRQQLARGLGFEVCSQETRAP